MTMKMKYMFDQEGKMMGSKMLETDNPDMNKSLGMMEASIFDMERMIMYNFMNVNGQKQYMGIAVKKVQWAMHLRVNTKKQVLANFLKTKLSQDMLVRPFFLMMEKPKALYGLA